jgi:hypothetical protein
MANEREITFLVTITCSLGGLTIIRRPVLICTVDNIQTSNLPLSTFLARKLSRMVGLSPVQGLQVINVVGYNNSDEHGYANIGSFYT